MKSKKDYLVEYENIMKNPKAKKIDYTVSDKYAKTLKPVFGIKEFIANFYDANGEDFYMFYHNKSLVLKDDNNGVDLKYMIIGNSGSRNQLDKIGEHGEGFKIGALTLIREGYKMLIHTVGYSIAFGLEYSPILKTEVMFAKFIENNRKIGTELFVECLQKDYKAAKNMFLFLNDYEYVNDSIIKVSDKIASNSIYLNGLEHTKKKSLFSYNIKEKNQISNRDRNFIQQSVLETNLIRIYENLSVVEQIHKVMDVFMANRKDFDKTLESKIINRISLTDEQKEMYKSFLDKDTFYTNDLSNITIKQSKNKKVVEVSDELYKFLTTINANVLVGNITDSSLNRNTLSTFIIPQEKLPELLDIEMKTASMFFLDLDNFVGDYKYWISSYNDILNILNSIKLNYRLYKTIDDYNYTKRVLNNIIFLACYDNFEIKIVADDCELNFYSYLSGNKYYVIVNHNKLRDNSNNNSKYLLIKPKKTIKKNYKIEKNTYIYINGLRIKKINGFSSYFIKIKNLREMQYKFYYTTIRKYHINELISEILKEAIKKDTKYLKRYMGNLHLDMYEYTGLQTTNALRYHKKKVVELFNQLYPNQCISSPNDRYEKIVESEYGYKIMKLKYNIYSELASLGVETAESVFLSKQSEEILTVDFTESMKQAVDIFHKIYTDNIYEIKLAIALPNNKESMYKDGVIYISKDSSNIPEYLASLMLYEYEKLYNKVLSPSHELQSILTHCLLD